MLGFEELIFIAIIALIILSPEKLTEFLKEIGKIYAEYKKAKRMVELEVLYGVSEEKLKEEMERRYKELEIELEEIKAEKSPPR
ncbi:MAG: twin-arginine translocase TatA/TatE family subunit [Archaeoglobaceae archaeon]|nr:twin-arginine translocase TatA/TatE family subunit [Archaeoglobaceae archaeon]MDW8128293.1 sec-independent translocation protein MttA [Archaeoglobaceae archaeon]